MVSLRVLSVCLLAASLICAADSNAVKQAAALVEQRSAKAPEALRPAFRKLDPERKTNTAFYVEGIPKSFLFDRQGRLVAQSIDMRTESQFLEMFKSAGLE